MSSPRAEGRTGSQLKQGQEGDHDSDQDNMPTNGEMLTAEEQHETSQAAQAAARGGHDLEKGMEPSDEEGSRRKVGGGGGGLGDSSAAGQHSVGDVYFTLITGGEGGGIHNLSTRQEGLDRQYISTVTLADEGYETVDVVRPESTQSQPMVATFKDHFTLRLPSSTIRYRDSRAAARVLEGTESQFVLEEYVRKSTGKTEVSIRKIQDSTVGVFLLRGVYALLTSFWTGFLFVFCLQILLFVFLDLSVQMGLTSKQEKPNIGAAMGAVFSIVPYIKGLASAMVIATAYVIDTAKGHPLIRNFTCQSLKQVTAEWLFFLMFLGFPLFAMSLSLLTGTDMWWTIAALFWFSSVTVFFFLFAVSVVFYEVRACFEITSKLYRNKSTEENEDWWTTMKRSIVLRQTVSYSSYKYIMFLSRGTLRNAEYSDALAAAEENRIEETREEFTSLVARFRLLPIWSQLGLYETLETPQRTYSIDDVRDIRPYVTAYTWSLEKIFCRPRNSRFIAIVKGPGAVTRAQLRSSLACSVLGNFLTLFLFLSFLVYLRAGIPATMCLMAVAILMSYPSFRSLYRLVKSSRSLVFARKDAKNEEIAEAAAESDADKNAPISNKLRRMSSFIKSVFSLDTYYDKEGGLKPGARESEAVYLAVETYRINKPSVKFCWFLFVVEVAFFFVWPMISLYSVRNYPLATLYILVVGVTWVRHYFNPAVILEEVGSMKFAHGANEREVHRNQARLNEIIGSITRARSKPAWEVLFGTLALVFMALFLGAVGSDVEKQETFDTPYTYVRTFHYPQKSSLRYPTCILTSDLNDAPVKSMADYAFLAGLAYRGVNVTQNNLDAWFTNGTVVDQLQTVAQYRADFNVVSPVSFKLVTFPKARNFAVLLIRGTTNQWDTLTDAQLWSAAALMQTLRTILPVGFIWSPIIDELIRLMNTIETQSIERVSFYKETSEFLKFIQGQIPSNYSGVAATGHSLGGGLAMISGAQMKVPAVGLSGPNAMLSRKSFDPPIRRDDLDEFTFNIIPERDVVPMIDDRAQNYQSIRCKTRKADYLGCHDSTRSLCEIINVCGTGFGARPVLCECVYDYDYPEPVPLPGTNITFAQACGRA